MSRNAWISAGKISAAVAALALVLGAIFQGQAQQRSEMAHVRAELRNGLADVRAELRSGLADVRAEFRSGLADVRAELGSGLADVRAELRSGLGEANARIDGLSRDQVGLRERVALTEGDPKLPQGNETQASATPRGEQGG